MTAAERARFVGWWREESGLSADELQRLAVGLGSQ
jgi:hypothetical protein